MDVSEGRGALEMEEARLRETSSRTRGAGACTSGGNRPSRARTEIDALAERSLRARIEAGGGGRVEF